MHLPVLDLHSPQFVDDLRRAAREVGFFYLTGHGADTQLAQQLMDEAGRFFDLPAAQKQQVAMVNSRHFRGWTRLGDERTGGRADWREQLDMGLDLPAHPVNSQAPAWQRLPGPNQWPTQLPHLRQLSLQWQQQCRDIALQVLRGFAVALDQPADAFVQLCEPQPQQVLKAIRYPGRDVAADAQGCGAHKDSEFVTLLWQDSVGGLQVHRDMGWIDAPPLTGSFIVNTGELLELASQGYLRATLHRVVAPPAHRQRHSLAFFLAARLDAVVNPVTLSPQRAAEARGVECDPANPLLHAVGPNTLKGRLRSHPDVARRHYADVLEAQSR
jgi:isopenicillin N synthase-like dioxygenase